MDDPYRTAIEERIRELQRWRRWLRQHPAELFWDDFGREYRLEAGALNRVRNSVRKAQHVEARGDHFVGIGR